MKLMLKRESKKGEDARCQPSLLYRLLMTACIALYVIGLSVLFYQSNLDEETTPLPSLERSAPPSIAPPNPSSGKN